MDKTDREVMQQALEALELEATRTPIPETAAAMAALRARLAEPEPEPVAWLESEPSTQEWPVADLFKHRATYSGRMHISEPPAVMPQGNRLTPLYTGPFSRRPLTDEEILRLLRPAIWAHVESHKRTQLLADARAIERAHNITGGNDE